MKILLMSFSIHGAMGDFFRGVLKMLSSKHEVLVLTNSEVKKEELVDVKYCRLPFDRRCPQDFFNPISYIKGISFLKKNAFDMCLECSPHPANLFFHNFIPKTKIIPFLHDHELHSGVKRLDGFFLKKNLDFCYKKCSKIIVSCNYIKDDILKKNLMTDASKISVVPLGLLENFIFPEKNVDVDIDVLFFGRIEYYKGLDILAKVSNQMPNVKFVIAGRGDVKKVFGLSELPHNWIRLNEYVPDEKLAELIQRSKMVVLPYRDATGSQTIQTVFYYRKPVIASAVGCFPEYISDGVDGFIVPPCDEVALQKKINILLEKKEIRECMGLNGRKKVDDVFSSIEIQKKYEKILMSLM